MLHSVYGKIPTVGSVPKQRTWIETQRTKASGGVVEKTGGFFSRFT
jgi:UDP-N-acetyl-D-mannosaminuronic acid transferase (WecB/TagA/CpsF family)